MHYRDILIALVGLDAMERGFETKFKAIMIGLGLVALLALVIYVTYAPTSPPPLLEASGG